jgi:hypothetical protein
MLVTVEIQLAEREARITAAVTDANGGIMKCVNPKRLECP